MDFASHSDFGFRLLFSDLRARRRMTVTCYPTTGKKKAQRICEAFAAGCGGIIASPDSPLLDGGAFIYGWTRYTYPLIERCHNEGRDWWYCDNAYYFGRPKEFRVTHNALMHDGSGPGGYVDHIPIKPWRADGRHIVLTTQSEDFYKMRLGQSRNEWTEAVVMAISRHSDRPVEVCHKPGSWEGRPGPHENFEAALPGAWAVVSHCSSTMVKSVAEGIPVFSLAPSMASRMGTDDLSRLEDPVMPAGRGDWLANLMRNQWDQTEMRNGTCWRELQKQAAISFDLARHRRPFERARLP